MTQDSEQLSLPDFDIMGTSFDGTDDINAPLRMFKDINKQQPEKQGKKLWGTKRATPRKTPLETELEGTIRKSEQLELFREFHLQMQARMCCIKRSLDKLNQDVSFFMFEMQRFKRADLGDDSDLSVVEEEEEEEEANDS